MCKYLHMYKGMCTHMYMYAHTHRDLKYFKELAHMTVGTDVKPVEQLNKLESSAITDTINPQDMTSINSRTSSL